MDMDAVNLDVLTFLNDGFAFGPEGDKTRVERDIQYAGLNVEGDFVIRNYGGEVTRIPPGDRLRVAAQLLAPFLSPSLKERDLIYKAAYEQLARWAEEHQKGGNPAAPKAETQPTSQKGRLIARG
jgi:hypothetical protein